jgi:hypothetical protein
MDRRPIGSREHILRLNFPALKRHSSGEHATRLNHAAAVGFSDAHTRIVADSRRPPTCDRCLARKVDRQEDAEREGEADRNWEDVGPESFETQSTT